VKRNGIAAAGNFIIDHIKVVDLWPDEGMLSLILEERRASGGCAYNVLKDLACLKVNIPLFAIGLVSKDEDGENRTFFHNKGVNKYLNIIHFDFSQITAKIFHIGYILLLDTLDEPDPEYGTLMARVLHMAKESGLKTSVDVVSESSYRFERIVPPALKYTDYLILNEIEAGRTAGFQIRDKSGELNRENLKKTLSKLLDSAESELVCIHFPEGAYAAQKDSEPHFVPSHLCPEGFIASTVGAGDAFCAGMLYGIHEEWDLDRTMRFANAMAAMCLTDMTTSGGMRSMEETLQLMRELPLRELTI